MSPELRDDLRRRPEYERTERESAQHERTQARLLCRIPEDHPQQPQKQAEEADPALPRRRGAVRALLAPVFRNAPDDATESAQ
jgi:hypothetical protein